ncbi:MAG: ATP-binding protein [Candidatus Woesearchaeota archaeon]
MLYRRKIVDRILEYSNTDDVIIVYGARQVGKTSLFKYLIENHFQKNSYFMDLEYFNYLELCNSGPKEVYDYLIQQGINKDEKIYLFIDEFQYMNNPTNFIKLIHDHHENIKLFVSGSSTLEIRNKLKDSLTGRTITFELYPLDFEEFLLFNDKNYKLTKDNSNLINKELINYVEDFIMYGGYPKIVLEKDIEKKENYLNQIINTYIKKDIKEIADIKINSFNKLIRLLAHQSTNMLNISKLSQDIGLNRVTLSKYIDILEDTFVIKRISPFHKNLKSELTKMPEVFMLDTGIMHILWLKQFPKEILGRSYESFIFLELLKNNLEVNYWRTKNKKEIDFIVKNEKLYAIEAKRKFKKSKTLNFFKEKYNSKTFVVGLYGDKKSNKYVWELIKLIKEKS